MDGASGSEGMQSDEEDARPCVCANSVIVGEGNCVEIKDVVWGRRKLVLATARWRDWTQIQEIY